MGLPLVNLWGWVAELCPRSALSCHVRWKPEVPFPSDPISHSADGDDSNIGLMELLLERWNEMVSACDDSETNRMETWGGRNTVVSEADWNSKMCFFCCQRLWSPCTCGGTWKASWRTHIVKILCLGLQNIIWQWGKHLLISLPWTFWRPLVAGRVIPVWS